MDIKTLALGQTVFCAACDGEPWHVQECQVGNESWIDEGSNVVRPVRHGEADTGWTFRGPSTDIFLAREDAQAACDRRQAAYLRQRDVAKRGAEGRREAARRREVLANQLYEEAMMLAADVDDMDVIEHYCQGNVPRLRKFIASRLP